ncbi:MAG: TonB-dependent receptor plug domain-containing protein [Gammaproteobacteria bacterium]
MWPTINFKASLIAIIGMMFVFNFAHADESEEEALLELYGGEELVSIATGTAQPISKAPAVASVINAAEIKEIGARDINDVLETVPGLHVSKNTLGADIYTFRGIYTSQNPQVLMLINGISVSSLFLGNRGNVWGGMPVEAISRIEVIRGPGSAVYGADAFAGVINIVTKKASEIDGSNIGVRYGSFNTKEAWALHGGNYGGFDIALMAEIKSSEGHNEDVDSDAISLTGASLTPESTNNKRENVDLRLDVEKGKFHFRGGLQRRRDLEVGFGVGAALDDNAEYESDRWNADLTYYDENLTENLDFQGQVSFYNTSQVVSEDTFIFPAGTPGFPPEGLIGNPEVWERHWRFNFSSLYSGIQGHAIRFGAGYNTSEIYRVEEENNFSGVLTDVSDTPFVFLPEKHRDNTYGFIQDIWSFANDWEFTVGLRYDDYNDFGDTLNPRAALVWSARHDTTLKLLYGQAFRAPSFAEFRNQNNPVALGNDELDPEEIETLEFAVDYRPREDLRLGANTYYYEWEDIIRFVTAGSTATAQNSGEQTGYGLELELEWMPDNEFSILANYAYQDSEDDETNEDSGNAPHHQFYARANWEFLPNWTLTPAINYVIDRARGPNDSRDELSDYSVVDLTLRTKAFSDKWEFSLGARNLFNSSPEEPTDASFNISNDLPLERRSVFAEFRINLQ